MALGNCQQLKSFPRQAGWTMWGESLTALGYPGCRVGTSGAGPEALDSTLSPEWTENIMVFVSRALHTQKGAGG